MMETMTAPEPTLSAMPPRLARTVAITSGKGGVGKTFFSANLAAALSRSSVSITNVDVSCRTCFLIGNEGHGLDGELINACSGSVIIPMQNGCESLNAAAAAAILMWESAKKHGFNE